MSKTIRDWAIKYKLVKMRGGKCVRCGLDDLTCVAVFDFHHRDPATKRFAVSSGMNNGWAWADLVEEALKCDLVCANCHRRLENPTQSYGDPELAFASFVSSATKRTKKSVRQTAWGIPTEAELIELLKTYSISDVGRMYGKSAVTARHWKVKYGLREKLQQTKPKVKISVEELTKLIKTKSVGEISIEFGISSMAVRRRLNRYGIINPRSIHTSPIAWGKD